ncbi:Mycothiol acetyltransferase [Lasiodiplodia hormozganensis]|uniref:Mycothiol acetyltransferase n=1 Tax=Lasiodiplodia hormozganensis TaxID=869390 RepID=A0AA40D684_9PEZI|nr:Mycothiol acetyltransferase [Lasiodiplodia hormozganensis]
MAADVDAGLISIRAAHGPSDIDHIITRHGALYASEYGWDAKLMEKLVASTFTEFLGPSHDRTRERLWIAERGTGGGAADQATTFVGCIMLFNDTDDPAHQSAMLRLLLVEPGERGKGLGRRLVRQAVEFARGEAGYRRVLLWMPGEMAVARSIYQTEGFEKLTEVEHEAFGAKSTAESWGLNF